MKFTRALAGMLVASALLGCSNSPQQASTILRGSTMGTTWSVTLASKPYAAIGEPRQLEIRAGIQRQLDRIVDQMSTWKPDSDLSRYNAADAGTWIPLESEFLAVLGQALDLARDSDGAYDPTVGPLVNLWGFGPDGSRNEPPPAEQIQVARLRVGWQRVMLDRTGSRVLQPGGVFLDLSSIAKGYAADRVSDYLLEQGYADSLVEIGGDLRVRGHRADGGGWRVALERPFSGAEEFALQSNPPAPSDAMAVLELTGHGLATSGDYRHRFEKAGREYSHHIDPRSGYPVEPAIAAVSVVATTCAEADPLGTTLIVMGLEAGMRWATDRRVAAVFLIRDGNSYRRVMTPAFSAAFGKP
ncbi:MAG: FAD:protein FMN transferase [Dokdonella sp.]